MRNPIAQQRAQILRKTSTDAEQLLWHHIRRRQLAGHRFRRQMPIGPYIADFACIEKKLIVEVDGAQHADAVSYDISRSEQMQRRGYRVIRFWDNQVLKETEAVLEEILRTLEDCMPPP